MPVCYLLAPTSQALGGEMLAGFPVAIDRNTRPPILSAEVFAGNPASLALCCGGTALPSRARG
ncbi:hypothetical protein [Paracoccus contaminans]|uniref:hypothetical protein n=1 Tax=Paracoccus contaminans TaxID=1945662 RepID=UPI0012F48BE5|nr:hypothetical protein [Paracoccus contaminans]